MLTFINDLVMTPPLSEQDPSSKGSVRQVNEVFNMRQVLIFTLSPQIFTALAVSMWQLIDGSCASIASTILYSWNEESENMTMSLEVAAFARESLKCL